MRQKRHVSLFITRTGHAVLREEGDVTRERAVIRKRQQKALEATDVVPHEEAGTLFRPGLLKWLGFLCVCPEPIVVK